MQTTKYHLIERNYMPTTTVGQIEWATLHLEALANGLGEKYGISSTTTAGYKDLLTAVLKVEHAIDDFPTVRHVYTEVLHEMLVTPYQTATLTPAALALITVNINPAPGANNTGLIALLVKQADTVILPHRYLTPEDKSALHLDPLPPHHDTDATTLQPVVTPKFSGIYQHFRVTLPRPANRVRFTAHYPDKTEYSTIPATTRQIIDPRPADEEPSLRDYEFTPLKGDEPIGVTIKLVLNVQRLQGGNVNRQNVDE
ncbi:MAG: hypothetical protein LBK76_01845 [Verrucomicrobiales bacterium]|jgi:hypothetical protein|nr:hypothetical protein [Verrucomicrobiales bacterium]